MKVIFGQSPHDFEAKLLQHLPLTPLERQLTYFPSGEFSLKIDHVSTESILVIPSQNVHLHEYLIEAQVLCYGAKKITNANIILLLPYMPYSRQDKDLKLGQFMIQQYLSAGANIILTIDIHNPDLLAPFPQCHNIPIHSVFSQDILNRFSSDDLILAAPDKGSYDRIKSLANHLSLPCIHLTKHRTNGDVTFDAADFDIDICNKIIILVDDIIDTATTIAKAGQILAHSGTAELHVYATHGVLSSPALEILQKAPFDSITFTNTLSLKGTLPNLRIIDASWIVAEKLRQLHEHAPFSNHKISMI
jgi:ribose-phosphate pyrophosphokinase